MKVKFKELIDCSTRMNERHDCAVKAVSIVARVSYFEAHKTLSKYGRKPRGGTSFYEITVPALYSLGIELTRVKRDRQKSGSKYTPKTIGEKCKKGY